jgi:hypothetical protein
LNAVEVIGFVLLIALVVATFVGKADDSVDAG